MSAPLTVLTYDRVQTTKFEWLKTDDKPRTQPRDRRRRTRTPRKSADGLCSAVKQASKRQSKPHLCREMPVRAICPLSPVIVTHNRQAVSRLLYFRACLIPPFQSVFPPLPGLSNMQCLYLFPRPGPPPYQFLSFLSTESSLCDSLASCVLRLSLVDLLLAHNETVMWGIHIDLSSRRKGLPTFPTLAVTATSDSPLWPYKVLRTSRQEIGDQGEKCPCPDYGARSTSDPACTSFAWRNTCTSKCSAVQQCSDEYAIQRRPSATTGDVL